MDDFAIDLDKVLDEFEETEGTFSFKILPDKPKCRDH